MSLQVRLIAGLHHPHIVRLLGYCDEYNRERNLVEQTLVYEFMPNGDLEAFVQNSKYLTAFILPGSWHPSTVFT